MPPTTDRVIETCLYVADVERAAEWYRQIFGFPVIFQQDDRLRALRVGQQQVLLLFKEKGSLNPTVMPGGVLPPHDGSGPVHIAFPMQTADADEWERHLSANGIEIIGRVDWGDDDRSLYFRDPDNHVLELITGGHWERLARK